MYERKEFIAESLKATEDIAAALSGEIVKRGFAALYGEMGAGKTAFVRGLVAALLPECLDLVHSPTFAIVNEYSGRGLTIYHFDLYRLKDEEDLYSTGFYDYAGDNRIIVTEWSENFPDSIPDTALKITIEALPDGKRRITAC